MVNSTNIRIFTSEKARYEGKPLSNAVVHYLHGLKIAARCSVFRGREGLYENGEISSDATADLSYNLPLLIDILVPTPEAERVLEKLRTMVHDGAIGVSPVSFVTFHSEKTLLPPQLLVRDVMTSPAVQAHPDFSLRSAVEILLDQKLKALPVVDGQGTPVGIVTTTDLLAAGMPVRTGLFSSLPGEEREAFLAKAASIPVTRVMTADPITVAEGDKASHAVHLMVAHQRKRLPVVDARGRFVGMVARIDLMRAVSSERPASPATTTPFEGPSPRTVREIAKLSAKPILETTDLLTAIDALVKQGEEQAAVVDHDGKLVGIVSDRELFGVLNQAGIGPTLKRLFQPNPRTSTVSQVMKREVVSIEQQSSVDQALQLMVERGLKRLPVVDGDHRFVGMIRRDALLITLSHDL